MSKTFLQMTQEVAIRMQRTEPTTIEGASLAQYIKRMKNSVNKAYMTIYMGLGRLNQKREVTGTITTASGTQSYSFPNGVDGIQQLRIGDDPPIRILPWNEFERYSSDVFLVTVTGYPAVATIYDEKVWFYPTPDGVYSVDVRGDALPSEMSADSDTPTLHAAFHYAIVELAIFFEMQFDNEAQAGQLMTDESGRFQAAGGQAANFVMAFNTAKKNAHTHWIEPPRIRTIQETNRMNALRRVIRGN